MKRIARIIVWMFALCVCISGAMAKEAAYYGHVDVRCAGSVTLTVNTVNPADNSVMSVDQTIQVDIKNIRVTVDGAEIEMSGQRKSESTAYPMEYQSLNREMQVPETAKIDVTCTFAFPYKGETRSVTGTYGFTPVDTNCQGTPKGIDLTVTAKKVEEIILEVIKTPAPTPTPVPTPTPAPTPTAVVTPTPVITPTPYLGCHTPTPTPIVTPTPAPTVTPVPTATPVPTITPRPTVTPRPTPTDNVPATGDYTDMWTVIFVLLGVCAIAGIVLVSVKRAHKR